MSDLHQQAGAAAGLVILGSGLGGYTLAREFRKLDRDTPVTLITADGGESYSKPMLSNAFAQNKDAGALVQKTADQMATDLSLTVLSRHLVESLDPADRAVVALAPDGRTKRISYDRLVLALGADPRHYRVPGS